MAGGLVEISGGTFDMNGNGRIDLCDNSYLKFHNNFQMEGSVGLIRFSNSCYGYGGSYGGPTANDGVSGIDNDFYGKNLPYLSMAGKACVEIKDGPKVSVHGSPYVDFGGYQSIFRFGGTTNLEMNGGRFVFRDSGNEYDTAPSAKHPPLFVMEEGAIIHASGSKNNTHVPFIRLDGGSIVHLSSYEGAPKVAAIKADADTSNGVVYTLGAKTPTTWTVEENYNNSGYVSPSNYHESLDPDYSRLKNYNERLCCGNYLSGVISSAKTVKDIEKILKKIAPVELKTSYYYTDSVMEVEFIYIKENSVE